MNKLMEAPNSMGVKCGQNYPQDSITWSDVLSCVGRDSSESTGRLTRTQKQLALEFPAQMVWREPENLQL